MLPNFIKNEPSPTTTITFRFVFNAYPNPIPITHPIAPLIDIPIPNLSKSFDIVPSEPIKTAFLFF